MQKFDTNKVGWFPFYDSWDNTDEAYLLFEAVEKFDPPLNKSDVIGGMTALMMEMRRDRTGWFNIKKITSIIKETNSRIDEVNAMKFFREMLYYGVLIEEVEEKKFPGGVRQIPLYSSPCIQEVRRKTSKLAKRSINNGKKHLPKNKTQENQGPPLPDESEAYPY